MCFKVLMEKLFSIMLVLIIINILAWTNRAKPPPTVPSWAFLNIIRQSKKVHMNQRSNTACGCLLCLTDSQSHCGLRLRTGKTAGLDPSLPFTVCCASRVLRPTLYSLVSTHTGGSFNRCKRGTNCTECYEKSAAETAAVSSVTHAFSFPLCAIFINANRTDMNTWIKCQVLLCNKTGACCWRFKSILKKDLSLKWHFGRKFRVESKWINNGNTM